MTPAVLQQLLRGHARRSIIALIAGGGSFIRPESTPMVGHTAIWLHARAANVPPTCRVLATAPFPTHVTASSPAPPHQTATYGRNGQKTFPHGWSCRRACLPAS